MLNCWSPRGAVRGACLAAILIVALACGGGKTPLDPGHADWAGQWVAADGTFVHVFADGGGAYKGSSSNIDGGTASFAGDKLSIGFGPISSDFHIDAPPTNTDGVWTVTLDGVVYTKQ